MIENICALIYTLRTQIMNITDTLNDLQNVLMQQNSIYETNQNLHFDWLQSVIFQLNVYDQSNKGDIKVNESKSITNLEQISYNYNMQQQTANTYVKKLYKTKVIIIYTLSL